MKRTIRSLWMLVTLAFALAATTSLVFAHGDPELMVSPDTVAAGATVRVRGMAVSENALIVLTLESENATIALGTVEGNAEGAFEKEFVIPAKTPTGNYQVRAAGADGRVARASLKILEAGAAPNAPIAATQLLLNARGGRLLARLQDTSGKPIAGQTITFTQRTTFGTLVLGADKTDANGIASIEPPDTAARETELGAEFVGTARWSSASALTILHEGMSATYSEIPASLITPNPPDALRLGIGLLIGGVWSVYAFAVYNLYRIWQDRGKKPARDTPEG